MLAVRLRAPVTKRFDLVKDLFYGFGPRGRVVAVAEQQPSVGKMLDEVATLFDRDPRGALAVNDECGRAHRGQDLTHIHRTNHRSERAGVAWTERGSLCLREPAPIRRVIGKSWSEQRRRCVGAPTSAVTRPTSRMASSDKPG